MAMAHHLRVVSGEGEQSVQVDVEVLRRHLVFVAGAVGPHEADLAPELNKNLESNI